jgi:hypothetical protein
MKKINIYVIYIREEKKNVENIWFAAKAYKKLKVCINLNWHNQTFRDPSISYWVYICTSPTNLNTYDSTYYCTQIIIS